MRRKLLCIVLMAVFFMSGCNSASTEGNFVVSGGSQQTESESQETLTLSMQMPKTLHPLYNKDETVDRILKLIYLPLIDIDGSGKAQPSIAQSWTFSEDGQSVTIQLYEDIYWQDGTKITADDVIYSLGLLRYAEDDTVYGKVKNYVASYRKNSETSVTVSFYHVFSGNLYALAFPVVSEAYDTSAQNAQMQPMGSGPYSFLSYQTANTLELSANAGCHTGVPAIDRITVKILNGEETVQNAFEQELIDVLVSDAIDTGRYEENNNCKGYSYPTMYYDFIGFNFQNNLFLDRSMREAIACLVPMESIMQSAYLGYADAAVSPICPSSWLYEENVQTYTYDMEYAKELLEEDGWQDTDNDGTLERVTNELTEYLSVSILCNEENDVRKQIAVKLADELKAAGFRATVESVDYATYAQRLQDGNFDLFVGGWEMAYVSDLRNLFGTDGTWNYIRYSDEQMDALLAAAYTAVEENQMLLAFSQLQQKLAEELPYISIAYRREAVFCSNQIGGVVSPTAFNVFDTIDQWTWNQS